MKAKINTLLGTIQKRKALSILVFVLIGLSPVFARAFIGQQTILDALYWIFAIINAGLAYILQALGKAFITVMTNHSYASEPFVLTGWAVVRDLVNLSFILVLIAIALFSILRIEKSAVRQLLPRLIAGVLLVNFSYFFCMQILNVSDGLAHGFLDPILNIQEVIFKFVQPENFQKLDSSGQKNLGFEAVASQFLALIFLGIMVGVFFILVIAMMIRYVFILILIVLSPFVFLLMILPQTSSYSKKWWKTFLGLAFWGPAAAFFIWLAILTFQSKSSPLVGAATGTNVSLLDGVKVTVGDIFKYITATAFLLAALYSGKVLAGTAAGMATRYAKRLGGLIGAGVMATPLGRPVFAARALKNNIVGAAKKREEYYTGRAQADFSDRWTAAKDAVKWNQTNKQQADAIAGVFAPRRKGYTAAYNKWQAAQTAEAEKGFAGLTKDERRSQLSGLVGKNDDQSVAKRNALISTAAKNGELSEWGLDPKNLSKSLSMAFGIKDKSTIKRLSASITELSKGESGDIRFAKGMKYDKASGQYVQQDEENYAKDIGSAVRDKQLKGQDALRKLDDSVFVGDGLEQLHAIGSLKRKTAQGMDIDLKSGLANSAVGKLNTDSSVNALKSQVEKALAGAAKDQKSIPLQFKMKDRYGKEQMVTKQVDRKLATDYVQNIQQIQNPNFQPAQNPRQNNNRGGGQQQPRRAPVPRNTGTSASTRPQRRPNPMAGRGGARGPRPGGPRGGGPTGGPTGGPRGGGPTGGGPGPTGGPAPAPTP